MRTPEADPSEPHLCRQNEMWAVWPLEGSQLRCPISKKVTETTLWFGSKTLTKSPSETRWQRELEPLFCGLCPDHCGQLLSPERFRDWAEPLPECPGACSAPCLPDHGDAGRGGGNSAELQAAARLVGSMAPLPSGRASRSPKDDLSEPLLPAGDALHLPGSDPVGKC